MIWAHSSCKAGVYGQTWRCSTFKVLRCFAAVATQSGVEAMDGEQALPSQVRPAAAIAPFVPWERSRPRPWSAMTWCDAAASGAVERYM
ncbi:hypothetical protein [Streptomyces sp. BP-8]|uniref:Uncharacterized protein n=1 Tax=Streptomyces sirii TaxID=3127701 RepID=A0ABZ2QJL3_9ACTN